MLERTAASLEPSGLQRVLPSSSTRYAFKARRHLHTGFWHHAAPDIELLDACHALMRVPLMPGTSSTPAPAPAPAQPEKKRLESTITSAFVLYFLYPNGTAALFRRFRPFPNQLKSLNGEQKARALSSRLYTSSAHDGSGEGTSLQNAPVSSKLDVPPSSEPPTDGTFDEPEPGSLTRQGEVEYHGLAETRKLQEQDSGDGMGQKQEGFDEAKFSGAEGLRKLLRSEEHSTKYDKIWTIYSRLDTDEKAALRAQVLVHLSRSSRPVESWKVCELFALYKVEEWTDDLVEAAIKARLRFQDVAAAKAVFTTAVEQAGLGRGLDAMVTYGLDNSNWALVLDSWALYSSMTHSRPSTIRFAELPNLRNFDAKIKALSKFAEGKPRSPGQTGPALADQALSFIRFVADRALFMFSPKNAEVLVKYAQDPAAYEAFIARCVERGWNRLAADVYRLYRRLPHINMSDEVLTLMVDIFYPARDVLGMEQLLEDWKTRVAPDGPVIPLRCYQKFIAFYARRGDLATVKRLSEEYLKVHKWARMDGSIVSALMKAHALAGDTDAALRVMEESAATSGIPPQIVQWNILLDSYAKMYDYEGGIKTFLRLCEEQQPDQHSFGVVMGMAGSRGDLRFTLELFKVAENLGVEVDPPMLDTLIEAYCRNDRFGEAEMLCTQAHKEGKIKGDHTCLWNTLLLHHARRRDLTAVNRILGVMTKFNIRYDEKTYSHLLLALLNCRQAHHALQFIRTAVQNDIFPVTLDHYVLLMGAFIHTGENHMAMRVNGLVARKFPDSAKMMTQVITALGRMHPSRRNERWGTSTVDFISGALWAFRKSLGRKDLKIGGPRQDVERQYSQIINILINLRDYYTIQEIISLYYLQFPSRASADTIPMQLLHDIMLADFFEGKHERVKSTFQTILDRTTAAARLPSSINLPEDPDEPIISPAFQYRMCDALNTMQKLHVAENDAAGLVSTVSEVRKRGFKLDSRNLNFYVQGLVRLNMWLEAFTTCEKELMPQWTGWKRVRVREPVKNQLPLEFRRLASNPRHPRPITHTFLLLAKVYIDLERITLWSSNAARMFEKINKTCPSTVKAVTSMVTNSSKLEKDVLKNPHMVFSFDPYSPPENEEVDQDQFDEQAVEEETSDWSDYDSADSPSRGSDSALAKEKEKPPPRTYERIPWREPWTTARKGVDDPKWKDRESVRWFKSMQQAKLSGEEIGGKSKVELRKDLKKSQAAPKTKSRKKALEEDMEAEQALLELEQALAKAHADQSGKNRPKRDRPPEEEW